MANGGGVETAVRLIRQRKTVGRKKEPAAE